MASGSALPTIQTQPTRTSAVLVAIYDDNHYARTSDVDRIDYCANDHEKWPCSRIRQARIIDRKEKEKRMGKKEKRPTTYRYT